MKYVFSYHTRLARPLWKGVVYESARLVSLAVTVGVVAFVAVWLVGRPA